MTRGEVWWADLPAPIGRRPVVLISRERAILVRSHVTVVPISSTMRRIPTEVALGPEDGLPKPCAANADSILTIPKARLRERVCALSATKAITLNRAIRFALALD